LTDDAHPSATSTTKHDDSHPSDATSTKHDEQPGDSHSSTTSTAKHDDDQGNTHSVRDAASTSRQTERGVEKKASEQPHHTASK
jgi:hypothetical protein